jgi:hypothetical protein
MLTTVVELRSGDLTFTILRSSSAILTNLVSFTPQAPDAP